MYQLTPEDKASVKVLKECIDLQLKKSADYQSPASSIKQAMHYRRGIETIHDMIHQKLLRAESLMEAARSNKYVQVATAPNFESLEDSYKDLINYASFAVAYIRGEMEGQNPNNDMFNEPKPVFSNTSLTSAATGTYNQPPDAQIFLTGDHGVINHASVSSVYTGTPDDQVSRTIHLKDEEPKPKSGPTTTSSGALGY